ncbi:ubiquinone biosynthesis regulatory protein kinase UbiB [Hahella sp. SMD15-11]|uniref:Probable protein kinase UbiB n=1 Tax=Thermohahella caldifontis TaxID=3142973 RepID=A0AB39UWH3_9GAMM
MKSLRRLIRILIVITRYRLDTFIPRQHLPLWARVLVRLGPWSLMPAPDMPRGERLRRALIELGPIYVKFGQILSTRLDLLPDDLARELAQLQDRVPPFDPESAVQIIERALKRPVDEIFAEFGRTPMASASVAQVHPARLHSGEEVVVKVIRPGIASVIEKDIRLMRSVARLIERYWEEGPRLHPVEVVDDYHHTIMDELDMQREAANTSQIRRNFEQSDLIYLPRIYWDYTRPQVLVMERIHGIPISDVTALRARGVDMKVLAERGVEIFFTQVFRDSFFHADMHPGNIFVDATLPERPRYIAIDCGIVGTLDDDDLNYLARNLLAFFRRDYRQVAQLHVESGWVPPETRVREFESAIRTVCEPIFEKPLKDISFGYFLLRLFQTARRFNMEVQPQLVLLQKTLLNVEGLGRQLYPDLDLWQTAQPFLERWMRERIAPKGLLEQVNRKLPDWLHATPELPQAIWDALNQARHLDTLVQQAVRTEQAQVRQAAAQRRQQRRLWQAGTLLAATAWLLSGPALPWTLPAELPWITALAGGWLLFKPEKSHD